eukprot:4618338-Pyramimonas_sp.AAC.1
MRDWRWLVHLRGRADPSARGGQLFWRDRRGRGGADRQASPSGSSLRVGDLGQRGIAAPSTTVDAMMIIAML